MRAITAILLLSIVAAVGCANRGMHAPDAAPGAGGSSSGGQAGTATPAGTGGTDTGGGGGGAAGIAGTGGGATGTGGACDLAADAGSSGGACGATFNFESGVQAATLGTGAQMAFKSIAPSSGIAYCGAGALAITAMFTGTTGSGTKGEVLINLPNAPVDLTGKTITVHVASDPGCSDLYLSMIVNTQSGQVYFSPPTQIRPITNDWQTGTVTVATGATTALALSLQMFSSTGYQGTVYVDEIDIK